MSTSPIEILLVEDNPGDAVLLKEALKVSDLLVEMNHVLDGVEALAYLRREREYAESKRPDLILLDLNMPKMDGRELLTVIKVDSDLAVIPVIILTTSTAEQDIKKGYELHASAYVSKPVGFGQFQETVEHISNFWFTIVRYPTSPKAG